MQLRTIAKRMFPSLLERYYAFKVKTFRDPYVGLTVEETFSKIYASGAWGSTVGEPFSSGHGSRSDFASRYVDSIDRFIRERGIVRVVDIGCGDFQIGKAIADCGVTYVGLDIVSAVIAHHQDLHGSDRVSFICANAIEDELPDGDLCLIRQVLQHLSNSQVSAILKKCAKYPYLIVTEDVYVGSDAMPNRDKPHGPDTRWFEKSGIFLDRAPFDLTARTLLEIPGNDHSLLRTVVVEAQAT